MEQLIRQYGNTIELVLSNNDDMALGALDSYRIMGYTKDNIPLILGGWWYAGSVRGCEGLGEINFKYLTEVYLPYQKVTIDNVDHYLETNEGNTTP